MRANRKSAAASRISRTQSLARPRFHVKTKKTPEVVFYQLFIAPGKGESAQHCIFTFIVIFYISSSYYTSKILEKPTVEPATPIAFGSVGIGDAGLAEAGPAPPDPPAREAREIRVARQATILAEFEELLQLNFGLLRREQIETLLQRHALLGKLIIRRESRRVRRLRR